MTLDFKYGRQIIPLVLPDNTNVPEFKEPVYDISRDDFIDDLVKILPDEPGKYGNIGIVVSDKTRLCGYPEYLPWLVDALVTKGAHKKNITFYIAYGTHARQSESESLTSYGEIYRNFTFVHHDCNNSDIFDQVTFTKRGTPVTIRKDILQCTLLITFGSISHHYFAGYGGGRKLLFPGLASRFAIYHNHGLFLDREKKILSTGCQPGNLSGNPLAEDLEEINTHLPDRISIHGILNSQGKVCKLRLGKDYNDFLEACEEHDSYFRYQSNELYDLVIASAGGYPKDINFIQAHKAVHHSAAFVKDGGKLIVLSECIDGIGSDYFLKYLEAGGFNAAFEILENHYEGNGGTALSMMTKAKRIQIMMVTSLSQELCNILGVKKAEPSDIQKIIHQETGKKAAIRNASMLIRQM